LKTDLMSMSGHNKVHGPEGRRAKSCVSSDSLQSICRERGIKSLDKPPETMGFMIKRI
jgi:hypothetical protein